ncbi:restriction endonuclease subunit S [Francisella hispaniensis]|uniref:Type I restriction-modification system specificity subunit n=1 Tax=Francisella hispaniensis TaxID=622488 RepID=F4BG98_9GAMM|nr:restriction endonuclease subunit S [Francisella hispaniensis]AEE26492.1 Type I restriction-modification system specificity subunit [Francisella hispaniensis]
MSELYKLPAGWEWKKLGDLAEYVNGMAFKPKDWSNDGFPIIRIQNLNGSDDFNYFSGEAKEKYYVKNGDILISWSASLDVYKWQGGNAILNQHIFNTIINYDVVDYDFFYHTIKYSLSEVMNNLHGVGMKHITKGKFENIQIPLPPLPEQKRIVAKLDSLFEKIDKAIELHQQNITNANTLMASTLDKTFKKLEGEYNSKKLDYLSENIRYGYTDKAKEKGNARFIRITDINDQGKFKDESVYVDIKNTDLDRYKLLVGDILVARSGATAGKVALFTLDELSVFASYLIRIRLQIDKALPLFIFYFCYSSKYWNQLDQIKIGGAQPNVNATNLKNIKIPLPPLPIQQQTVEYLDSIATKVDKIKQLNEQKLEKLKALKASILDKAFRGEL